MKLIHPTAIVTMPIAMQRSDAVQIVPATIQTTPAKMIARETRLARTLSLITRYAQPKPDLNRQTTPAATAMAVTQQTFLFLFAGREVRLPSRRRTLLAWGSGDCLDLFFLRLLPLPIASLFASGHVNPLWLMNRLLQPLQRLCPNAQNAPEQ